MSYLDRNGLMVSLFTLLLTQYFLCDARKIGFYKCPQVLLS